MMLRPVMIATIVGITLQVGLVLAGHVVRVLQDPGFAIGGLAFSAVAGWTHARLARGGWRDAIVGGAIAGGICAAVGIFVSAALGDVPFSLLAPGTAGSVVTGMIGAGFAKLLTRPR